MPPVFGTAFPFDQSFFRQFINQNDHATGEDTEGLSQCLLVARGSGVDYAQDSRVGQGNAQHRYSLAEAVSPVRAKLSK